MLVQGSFGAGTHSGRNSTCLTSTLSNIRTPVQPDRSTKSDDSTFWTPNRLYDVSVAFFWRTTTTQSLTTFLQVAHNNLISLRQHTGPELVESLLANGRSSSDGKWQHNNSIVTLCKHGIPYKTLDSCNGRFNWSMIDGNTMYFYRNLWDVLHRAT